MVSTFQSGHGFTVNSGPAIQTDTADFTHGTQSIFVTTDGVGGISAIRKTSIAPTLDLSAKQLRVFVKVSDVSKISDLILYLSSDNLVSVGSIRLMPSTPSATVAIIRSGEWAQITLGWGDWTTLSNVNRAAVNAIQLRAKDQGTGAITVRWGAVLAEPRPSAGAVSFSFDDGWTSQFDKARPILDTYGYRATAYMIHDAIDRLSPTYMTTDQVTRLKSLSRWEIASHADTSVSHNARYPNVDDYTKNREFFKIKKYLNDQGYLGSDHFAYPGGDYDDSTLALIRKHFVSARSIWGAGSSGTAWTETWPPADPHRLRAWSVLSTDAAATVTAQIAAAATEKEWLILVFHKIVTGAPGATTEYQDTNFQTIVDFVNTNGISCRPVGDVIRNGS